MFTHEIRNQIAWVTFDSGGMNTLSGTAIQALGALLEELRAAHARMPLNGVILKGNRFGLGAGANIAELMAADAAQLRAFIDRGHEVLYAIEDGPFPWLAVVDGFALGGIYELALACHGIIATEKSAVGFPEIRLNIFPGLGGTQRMPRRSGLINARDPMNGDAGFTAVLTGKHFKAKDAAAIRMIDAVIPAGADVDQFAERYLLETLPTLDRTPPADLANAESFRPLVLPMIEKATLGRSNPRAPYVALDVMVRGAALPLKQAIEVERDAFIEVGTSPEARAGMRFFFTQQTAQKLPKSFPGKARPLEKIAVDGADGYMGNAIAWLALEAGYKVVAHVPLAQFAASVPEKLAAKYGRALKKGAMSADDVQRKVASVQVTTALDDLRDCDLVIEARMENREIKAQFYRALGGVLRKDALVASNSSSMGPGLLGADFAAGGGDTRNFVNLHFFSPAEHPIMQLVEVIAGDNTSPDAVATAHAFARSINKTPVLLRDGSAGFLVNAGLAAYMLAAEALFREGTPASAIDDAMRARVFPIGPFELGDQAGLDIAAGMFDTIAATEKLPFEPLAWKMREHKRFGAKSGGGVYDYRDGKRVGEWAGLATLVADRATRVAGPDEIVERCLRALYAKARELCDRKIVGSEEECDLAFVLGIGFAMHLGGPIYYAKQQGWERG
ncbi:MAG: 3-hydroxyacyl-CoA dehydrogenase NAD-binding domain-containing protein [Candidatus Binatia bacterium]